jgi:hypothetical protein
MVMLKRAVCDKCQNYFGSKIELFALNNYPFSHWRVFGGLRTKKGKAPFFHGAEGTFIGDPFGGAPSIAFHPVFQNAILDGRKTQMRLLAQPHQPIIVCRFLLKMGLEMLHENDISDVFAPRFADARAFARAGDPGSEWWFALAHDNDDSSAAGLSIHDLGQQDFMFLLYGSGTTLMCPLVAHIRPGTDEVHSDMQVRYFRCRA